MTVVPELDALKKKRRLKRVGVSRNWFIALCVLPAAFLFLVFMVYPTINVFWMSLFNRSAYSTTQTWAGLDNFKTLMNDAVFIRSMQNMILMIVVVTIITFTLALIFAGILSREKVKGQNFFRIIFYIPNILSVVVISAIFSAIYQPDGGLLNSILSFFSGREVMVLWKGESLVIPSIIIAMVWQAIGYYMVMYMASMAGVPESLYESASLDGASKIHQFFHVTIPLIWPNIRTTLTFFIISSINIAFLFVTAMTNGGPNNASNMTLYYMYNVAYTQSAYGYGMAIGVVVFLFSFGLAALVNAVTSREVLEV